MSWSHLRLRSRVQTKENNQVTVAILIFLLAAFNIFGVSAVAAEATRLHAGGSISKNAVRDKAESDGPLSGEPPRVTVLSGGKAPTVQAVQRYIDPTYLAEHTTNEFNSSGGDLLVMYASSHEGVVFSPCDNYGNTWISIAGPTSTEKGFDLRSQIWYAPNAKVGPKHTVTMRLSEKQPLVVSIFVVRGADPRAPVQAISGIGSDQGGKSVQVSSPTVSTRAASELLLGWVKVSVGASFRSGEFFFQQSGASSNFLDAESETLVSPGTYHAAFTLSGAQTWQSAVVAIAPVSNQVWLTWSGTHPGSKYLVERCAGTECDDFERIAVTARNYYNDPNLKRSSYRYRVREEYRKGSAGPYSTVAEVALKPVCLPVPLNLKAAAISISTIDLSWSPAPDPEPREKYLVERCLGAKCSDFSPVTVTAAASFRDTRLIPGATYSYRIRALDTTGRCSATLSVQSRTKIPDGVGYLAFFAMVSAAPWYKRAWSLFV